MKKSLCEEPYVKGAAAKGAAVEEIADFDLAEELQSLTISKQAPSASPVPENILNLMVLQDILMNIPETAHPAVKDYLKSTALEFLEINHVSTQDLMKHLPSVSREMIKLKVEEVSCRAEISLSLVLTPPVSCCIKVIMV